MIELPPKRGDRVVGKNLNFRVADNTRPSLASNSSVGFIRMPPLTGCDLGWPYSSIKRVCCEAHSH